MEKRNKNRTKIINPAITLGDYENHVDCECKELGLKEHDPNDFWPCGPAENW